MITEQNIKIDGDTLEYNGHVLSIRPPKGMVNVLRVKENDTIKNAIADSMDIFIEMESGDRFILRDYFYPNISRLVREAK
ncbi:MAG: hypothetical protein ACM3TR_09895 [Caulobacteraceae bacterium]